MAKKIPSWRDTKNRRMRDCFIGRQLPESMGIAQRTELFFLQHSVMNEVNITHSRVTLKF